MRVLMVSMVSVAASALVPGQLMLVYFQTIFQSFNPTNWQGGILGTFLWSNWLFPNIYDNASHTLSEAQNGLKRVSIVFLLLAGPEFRSKNKVFGPFRAKMTTLGIQNPKLIVTNNYQQFLAHFEWFLALFHISDVKPELP